MPSPSDMFADPPPPYEASVNASRLPLDPAPEVHDIPGVAYASSASDQPSASQPPQTHRLEAEASPNIASVSPAEESTNEPTRSLRPQGAQQTRTVPLTIGSDVPGPAIYRIGSSKCTPLVTGLHLIAHLRLLGAFRALRTTIEEGSAVELPPLVVTLDAPQRWAWFVGLAVGRFRIWAIVVKRGELARWVKEEIPPLDVLMVWHAYMLNPRWYAEDCERLRIMKALRNLGDRLLPAVIQMGDPISYRPHVDRLSTWLAQTDTPFDPLEAAQTMTYHVVKCPKCSASIQAPYLTEDGTGYAQRHFSIACTQCLSMRITKKALALSKFVDDLVSNHENQELGLSPFLAGTLHTDVKVADKAHARQVKIILIRKQALRPRLKMTRSEWKQDIMERFLYSTDNLPAAAAYPPGSDHAPSRHMMCQILMAYTDDWPFSVDLVGAVTRQGEFINKMHELGWTNPGFFDDPKDLVVLAHAIARYHAFLDLTASTPTSLLVPTLDIDLVWHTHQLMASTYASDCLDLVGRYVNHDDKVEESFLANSLDTTCRAWEQHFGVPYMHCGCPLPGDTIGQRLNHLSRMFKSNSHGSYDLEPPRRYDAFAATHVSEHNSVLVSRGGIKPIHSVRGRPERENKMQKRRERDAEKVSLGKMDMETFRRGDRHNYAFLVPVPLQESVESCVATSTQLTCGTGMCAVGAGVWSAGRCGAGGDSSFPRGSYASGIGEHSSFNSGLPYAAGVSRGRGGMAASTASMSWGGSSSATGAT